VHSLTQQWQPLLDWIDEEISAPPKVVSQRPLDMVLD
jgi:hypothetical protein